MIAYIFFSFHTSPFFVETNSIRVYYYETKDKIKKQLSFAMMYGNVGHKTDSDSVLSLVNTFPSVGDVWCDNRQRVVSNVDSLVALVVAHPERCVVWCAVVV